MFDERTNLLAPALVHSFGTAKFSNRPLETLTYLCAKFQVLPLKWHTPKIKKHPTDFSSRTSQGADLQKGGAPGRARWSTRSLQQWVMGLSEKGFRVLGHPKAVHGHREDAFCSTIKFTIVKHLGANVFRSQPTSRFEK